MVNLEYLNNPELLENIKIRFKQEQIYTWVGPTLLVVNPYKQIKNLYSQEKMFQYYLHIFEKSQHALAYQELPAHIFSISAESFRQLFFTNKNQAIVISGESGAGKTENAKHAMKFITQIACFQISTEDKVTGKDQLQDRLKNGQFTRIENKIISCNPILEALGNSKTNRNFNSSRFGKYVTMIIDKESKKIKGARIKNYLLEKSRITSQQKNERNFHIFYQFLIAADQDFLQKFKLDKNMILQNYQFLNKSECFEIGTNILDDRQNFEETLEALKILGFTESQDLIWRIISSVLKLGNLEFDDSQLNDDSPCRIKNDEILKEISELLQIDLSLLQEELVYKQFKSGQNFILKPIQKAQCNNKREAFCKFLYDKLFSWVVNCLNETLMSQSAYQNFLDSPENYLTIGILDIYGFEVFEKNYFEQFFINYTNERIQQLYILYVFKLEEKIFIQEGLQKFIKKLEYRDNQSVINLLDNQDKILGIFNILDDCCSSTISDDGLLEQIKKNFEKNKLFSTSKFSGSNQFTIFHTPNQVEYTITGFIEKNKDDIKNFENLIAKTKDKKYMSQLVNEDENMAISIKKSNNYKEIKFSSAKFRKEINELMNNLVQCEVSFIRCIKPNENKSPDEWEQNLIDTQIKYLGILETIRVRIDSYPIRREYKLFYKRYGLLSSNTQSYVDLCEQNADFKHHSLQIFKENFRDFDDNQVLFGNTQVFLRLQAFNSIEEYYLEQTQFIQATVKKFQERYFSFKQLQKFRKLVKSSKLIIRYIKSKLVRFKFLKIKKSVTKIQRSYKRKQKYKKLKKLKTEIKYLQTFIRSSNQFKKFQYQVRSANLLQIFFKKKLFKIHYIQSKQISNLIRKSAFEKAWEKIQFTRSIIINKNIRGYIVRKIKFKTEYQTLTNTKIKARQQRAVMMIQRFIRGYQIRQSLNRLQRATRYIQGFFKSKWLNEIFNKIRLSVKIIQKYAKGFLARQKFKQILINKYFQNSQQELQDLQYKENQIIFDEFSSINKCLDKQQNNPENKKMYLITHLIDLDIIADLKDIYTDETWAFHYSKLAVENYQKQNYNQYLSLGDTHSIIIPLSQKLQLFGWNDYGQLAIHPANDDKTSSYQFPNRLKIIGSGKNHNLALDYNGDLFSWGKNQEGQLGKGVMSHSQWKPEKISTTHKFKNICVRDNLNFAISEEGRTYQWPIYNQYSPQEILSLRNEQIHQVSCGRNFTVFLNNNGILFSFGINKQGQLGLGDTQERDSPTLIECLRDYGEKFNQIECGFAHVIAKSSRGKIFTWGWGSKGQLGHSKNQSELSPKQLTCKNIIKLKIIQVQAAIYSSILLTDKGTIYWFGTNNTIRNQLTPTELNIQNICKRNEEWFYDPIRITSQWNNNISTTSLTLAYTKTAFHKKFNIKGKILNQLTTQWVESGINSIDPPYMSSISKYLSEKHMKMPTHQLDIQFESKKEYKQLMSLNFFDTQTPPRSNPIIQNTQNNLDLDNFDEKDLDLFESIFQQRISPYPQKTNQISTTQQKND